MLTKCSSKPVWQAHINTLVSDGLCVHTSVVAIDHLTHRYPDVAPYILCVIFIICASNFVGIWPLPPFPMLLHLLARKPIKYWASCALFFADDHSQQYLIRYYSRISHAFWFLRWSICFSFQNSIGCLSNADLWFVQPGVMCRSRWCFQPTHSFICAALDVAHAFDPIWQVYIINFDNISDINVWQVSVVCLLIH